MKLLQDESSRWSSIEAPNLNPSWTARELRELTAGREGEVCEMLRELRFGRGCENKRRRESERRGAGREGERIARAGREGETAV